MGLHRTGKVDSGLGRALMTSTFCLAISLAAGFGQSAQSADCDANAVPLRGACVAVAEVAEDLAAAVQDAIEEDGLKAVLLAVEVAGKPVLTHAWGKTMTAVPATADMRFRNGAIAIAYMGVLALQLQEEGLLSLDDPLSQWLPDLPMAEGMTVRMLADGTAGYADYVPLFPFYDDVFRQWREDELLAIAFAEPLVCAPGSCFAYAHTNYILLGRVLEAAAEQPLAELLQERILAPLGLTDTHSGATARMQEPVLHAFTSERGLYEDSTYWNPSWTLAQGAIMTTTVEDAMASFAAIGPGELLSAESQEQLLAPTTAGYGPFDEDIYYAFGLLVSDGWLIQTPAFAGFSAVAAHLPDQDIGFAVTATAGPETSPDLRTSNRLAVRLGRILAPDQPPRLPER
ncbi:serine hydrolase domain-containing protein [Aquibaculum arenosum]|nr:serine hydrolase domain-containing protein [Fodinicurvata sp. CAU 1616]